LTEKKVFNIVFKEDKEDKVFKNLTQTRLAATKIFQKAKDELLRGVEAADKKKQKTQDKIDKKNEQINELQGEILYANTEKEAMLNTVRKIEEIIGE